jgi:hypothetical protein
MWERERDSSRFPYNMDWGIAAALHLPRQFGRLQWLTADNPARMVLYPGTGGPYPAHRLDISHWLKITAAISMYIADRFVKNPYTYAHGGQVQEYDWPRVRRLVMHPTGRLTQHRNTSPAIAAQLSPDSISWLLGQAGARPQVRHKVPLERKCRWGNWFVGPKMVLFLNCVVELEVRAHKIWEAARDAGELDEEWTPYGPIGSWWPCGRVSPALRGEYAAEPLPETRAVRILAAASPHSFNHLFNSNSELRDLCVACGPDVWPEVRSGKATARYSGSV